jgi:hypothetical protein
MEIVRIMLCVDVDEDPDWFTRLDTQQEDPSGGGAAGVNSDGRKSTIVIDSSIQ